LLPLVAASIMARKWATTVSFEAASGQPLQLHLRRGDLNRDNIPGNDLIFVPADRSQINLVLTPTRRRPDRIGRRAVLVSSMLISQTSTLNDRRGDYAERNGSRHSPWYTQLRCQIRR
jgi:hypothetical protein